MMELKRALLAVVFLCLPVLAHAADDESARRAAVDALFAKYAQPGSPGLAVGIYQGDRELYAKGYGQADLDNPTPITPQTVFHVASVSKQFTAFAILLLARDGKVDLDADIRKYLPYVPDFGHVITVRHLLNHTSGLRDQWYLFDLGGIESGNRRRQTQIVNLVSRQRALSFVPGTEFVYCNTGYTLLAEIVRAVSGQTLREFTTERIFKPLGMPRMFFYDDPTELVPGRAQSYSQDDAGHWRREQLFMQTVGATSLHATVGDFARWSRNFKHPVVGDAKLIQQFTSLAKLADGTPINYGFGLYHRTILGHEAVLHSGSDAGFRSYFAYFPADDLTIVVLSNSSMETDRALHDLAAIYFGNPHPYVVPAVASDLAAAGSLAGLYQSVNGPVLSLESRADGLYINEPGSSHWSRAVLRADGTFDRGDWPRSISKLYRPERDRNGQVVELVVPPQPGQAGDDGRSRHYKKLPPIAASELPNADILGDYQSTEVDATYSVSQKDGALWVNSIWFAQPIELKPVVRDGFRAASPLVYVTVKRDAGGHPAALLITTERIRNLEFRRIGKSDGR